MTATVIPFVDGQASEARRLERGVAALTGEPGTTLWVDVTEPTDAQLDLLHEEFRLPDLAVEDVREGHQRPKLDQYQDCLLLVAYAAQLEEPQGDGTPRIALRELGILVGTGYLITVRHQPFFSTHELVHRVGSTAGRPLRSPTAVAHAILDHVVDGYFEMMETIESSIEEIDEKVWTSPDESFLPSAFALRHDLVRFRRVVAPLREVLSVMVRREGGVLDDTVDEQLRDLYDHIITVYEDIEMSRELLAGALEGHLSVVSNRMNEVVLKVSAWAAIIAVPTVIASIYGMNFAHMPELRWSYGYPMAVALMLAAAIALYLAFRSRRWL